MSHDLILILALVLPTLLFTVLRANAAMIFLSVCLGAVLLEHVASQATVMLGLFTPRINTVSQMTIELCLLLGPAIATTIVTVSSVHGQLKVIGNIVPAAAASMLALLLAVPLLPKGMMFALMSEPAWRILSNAEAIVVGVGALVSLFFLWTQRGSFRHHDKRKHS